MKHNLKRLLSFVLALAMCMSMVWVPAFAAEVGTTPPTVNASLSTTPKLGNADDNGTWRDPKTKRTNASVTLCRGQSTNYFSTNNGLIVYGSYDSNGSEITVSREQPGSRTNYNIKITAGANAESTALKLLSSSGSYDCTVTVTIRDHSFNYNGGNNDATCTKNETKTGTCEYCGATETVEIEGTALDHNFTEVFATVDATCTDKGSVTYKCSRCDEKKEEETDIDPNNHSFTNYVSDNNATCAADGTKTAECDNGCGEKHPVTDEGSKDKVDHTWGEWVVTKEPTETEKGEMERTCSVCGKTETQSMNSTTHVHTPGEPVETVTKEATCLTPGSKEVTITCTECGETYYNQTEEIPVDPDAHFGDVVETNEDIHLDEGYFYAVETYSGCKHEKSRTQVELDGLPDQKLDGILRPLPWASASAEVNLHAGQKATVQLATDLIGSAGSALGLEFAVNYNHDLIDLYFNGEPVNDTVQLRALSATTFTIVAKDLKGESLDNTSECEITVDSLLTRPATIKATITPHVATPGIVNSHEPTCTEPGKLTLDTFCKFCGYQMSSEDQEILTPALGHALGAPKWDWVLTRDAEDWVVTAKQICGRDSEHVFELPVTVATTSEGSGYKVYTATVTGEDGKTYTAKKTEEMTYSYTYNDQTVPCYYGQKITLNADTKSDWYVNGEKVAAGTTSYTFRVSKKTADITTKASAVEQAVTALTTIKRIKNDDGSYTAKFTTDWYVPAGQKVQSVKTYYRLTNTTQTKDTLVTKNQSVTSKLTNNAGTFIANISVKAQYGKTYKVYAVSCVTLDDESKVWSEVVINEPFAN